MKFISNFLMVGGLLCTAILSGQPTSGSGGGITLSKSGDGTLVLEGNNTVTRSTGTGVLIQAGNNTLTLTASGGYAGSIPYGSGHYPHLQNALLYLQAAMQELNLARNSDKADYRDRAIMGVRMAITDVKLSIDHADQKTVPPIASLANLPDGLGNPSSNLVVAPLVNPKVTAPHMDAAIIQLNGALRELHLTTNGDPATGVGIKGDYLPRAMVDVAFAIENSKAAINMVNGVPPMEEKPSAPVSAAGAPGKEVNFLLIELSVAGLTIAIFAVGAWVMRLRKGSSGTVYGSKQMPGA